MIVTKSRVLITHIRPLPRNLSTIKQDPPQEAKPKQKQDNIDTIEKPVKSEEKNAKEQSIKEAQSYEKWLANLSYVKKDAQRLGEAFQDRFVLWRKDHPIDSEWYAERVSFFMKRYENFVGLTEVKAAQALVVKEERLLDEAQEKRRDCQLALNDVQTKLKSIRSELERTPRGDDKYLELVTQEHTIIKEENQLISEVQSFERVEKEKFKILSAAIRNSHEKERSQAEKTKYWSVLGSVIGTCLGILGTTINNRLRMRELRQIVTDSTKVHSNLPGAVAGAGVAAAGSAITLEAFQDQQTQIENLSSNFLNIFKDLDKKLDEVKVSLKDQENKKPIVISNPSDSKDSKFDENYLKDLELISDSLNRGFKKLENGLFDHNSNLIESLGKTIHSRDAKFLETLKQTHSNSYNTFSSRICDIEEKVKDVRSLLLTRSMAASSLKPSNLSSSKINPEDLARTNQTILDTVEISLQIHEERMTQQVVATGVMVVILVPLVSYIANKLF